VNLDTVLDCYHESGHCLAFVAQGLGHQIGYVIASPTRACVHDLGGQRTPLNEAVIDMAGPISEARYARQSIYEILQRAGRTDFKMANEALRRYSVDEFAKFIGQYGRSPSLCMAIDMATDLVERHWREICRLIAALLQRERLSSEEVMEVLG
jgi:hypothetical protein